MTSCARSRACSLAMARSAARPASGRPGRSPVPASPAARCPAGVGTASWPVGATLGSAVPLALTLTQIWQAYVLGGAAVLMLALRRGPVFTLLSAAAAGLVIVLGAGRCRTRPGGGQVLRRSRTTTAATAVQSSTTPR